MKIGVPRETKTSEYRVGITPAGVRTLVGRGHQVLVERGAGKGSGIPDADYEAHGAVIAATAAAAWDAEMVIKVKEPLPSEFCYLHPGLLLYTYLHLAADGPLTRRLQSNGVTSIAYETIRTADGGLPLLKPMSEVAGRMAIQVGAMCLEKEHGGRGVLLGGVPGTRRGKVVVLGGGIVGRNAAAVAVGMGARVTVLELRAEVMASLEDVFGGAIETLYSNEINIEEVVRDADLLVGGVLVTGATAPKLVSRELVGQMKPGSVIVDVAVDQGGCIATCRPTTHDHPTFRVSDVVHYCVANMPGAVPHTSTWALTNATIRYAVLLADLGVLDAVRADADLATGINTLGGHVTCEPVARAHEMDYVPVHDLVA